METIAGKKPRAKEKLHYEYEKKYSVGTLTFESPDLQVVRILIVSFSEHQQRNANLQKGHSDGSGTVVSLMIKVAKIWKRARRKFAQLELHTFPLGGIFFFILEFLLDFRKDNIVILVIRYLFPY